MQFITFTSLRHLIDEVIRVRRDNLAIARKDYTFKFIKSRGISLLCMDENGRCYDEPLFCRGSNPTLKELKYAAQLTLENGGHYVAIDGDFDGSDDFGFDDYDPCLQGWGVDITCKNILAL